MHPVYPNVIFALLCNYCQNHQECTVAVSAHQAIAQGPGSKVLGPGGSWVLGPRMQSVKAKIDMYIVERYSPRVSTCTFTFPYSQL